MTIERIYKDTLFNFFLTFALTLITAVLAIYLRAIGYSYTSLGWLLSLFPLMIIILVPLLGSLADSWGKRTVLVIALFFEILALVLYLCQRFLILARLLEGIAATTLALITFARAEDHIRKKRGEKTGFFLSLGSLGKILASPITFFLIQRSLKAPFFVSLALLSLLLLSLLWRKHLPPLKKTRINYRMVIKTFFHYPELKGMAILGIVKHATIPLMSAYLPLYLKEEYGLGFVGIAFFFLEVPHLLQWWFGKIADKKTAWHLVFLGLFISGIATLGIGHHVSRILILGILFGIGVGDSLWNISAWSVMSKRGAQIHKEGTIITSYHGIAKIGSFLSYLISGILVTQFGIFTLVVVNIVFLFLGCALAYPYFLHKKQKVY